MTVVKVKDLHQAVLNWQNAIGASSNGELEAFLGLTLGDIAFRIDKGHTVTSLTDEGANRVKTLLSSNHKTMIKAWLARND